MSIFRAMQGEDEPGAPFGAKGVAMITIELSQTEIAILMDMIDTCISDLHDEIRRTDSFDFKEELKQRKAILSKLRHQLQQSTGSPA